MKLEKFNGTAKGVKKLVVQGQVQLAQLADGTWVALTNRSADPCQLAGRANVNEWANAQGFRPRDVHNYIRRERRQVAKDELAESINEAKFLLRIHGFSAVAAGERA